MRPRPFRIGAALAVAVVLAGACDHPAQPPTPPTSAAPVPGPGSALAVLQTLPVKGRAPMTGYTRSKFGPAWTDDVSVDGGHNGCDTRDDILRRSLSDPTLKAGTRGCVILTGVLVDPYTGRRIVFRRGAETSDAVQIDHVAALGDVWQTGAQQLSADQRTDLANDPLELLAVDGPTNQAKGDGDAATWLPPDRAFRCRYVARQIAVKQKYRLWVTAAEKHAMAMILGSCPTQPLPLATDPEVAVPGLR